MRTDGGFGHSGADHGLDRLGRPTRHRHHWDSPALIGEPSASPGATGNVTNGGAIAFPGPRVEVQGFHAPAADPRGAMLVVHENRGLNNHIRSVASRLAADGYSAIAIDLLSEEGGSEALAQGDVQAAPRMPPRSDSWPT